MGHRTLDRRLAIAVHPLLMVALTIGFATVALQAQTAEKKHSIFDDDPPSSTPGPATPGSANPGQPRDASPTPGAASGLIATLHGGDTTEARPREYHLTPNLGITFVYPLTPGAYVPMAFSWRGLISIPAGGAQGVFQIKCTGESDLMIDGQVVSAVHPGDPAASFERPQNLAQGVHAINATVFHLQGTGVRQSVQFLFKPAVGVAGKVPRDWFWHLRADEPADLTAIKPANPAGDAPPQDGGAGQADPRRAWLNAGTPRPEDPAARPGDLLAGVVVESYSTSAFERFKQFRTLDRPQIDLNVAANFNAVQPANGMASLVNASFKWRGLLKIDAAAQCRFVMAAASGQVRVIVDNRVVAASGFPNEEDIRAVMNLAAGLHPFEVELSRLRLPGGAKYSFFLQWELNGQPYDAVPANVLFHYRSQEPFAPASVAGGAPSGSNVTAPIPVRIRRLAIPDPDAQARSAAQLQQRYSADWTAPPSAPRADRLMKAADENRGDAVAMFVLLQKAYQQAVAASAVDLAFKAIDRLSEQFSVDGVRMKLAVLKIPGSKPITAAADMRPVTEVFQQAIAEDNFTVAADAAAISLAQAKSLNVPAEIEAANQRVRIATAAGAEFPAIRPILTRLVENANDAEANLAAGKFYCFTARNWTRGAPFLARCDDPTLSWLGAHEMTASIPPAQMALANGWWDAAAAQNETVAAAMREHAADWYRTALPSLTGLSHRLAERRAFKATPSASVPDARARGVGKS